MRRALEAEGYRVETAGDGLAGLDRFGDGTGWDLVLLDQRMAEMAGLEVLRRMRETNPGVPVILVTAFGTAELAQSTLGSGASGFLTKPMLPEELRGVVRDVLSGR